MHRNLKLTKNQETSKRGQSCKQQKIPKQINEQNWPLLEIRTCAQINEKGIFTAEDIRKGTLLCDYHGTIVSDNEGWRRYKEYGDNAKNAYMLNFTSNSVKKNVG